MHSFRAMEKFKVCGSMGSKIKPWRCVVDTMLAVLVDR